MLRRPSAPIRRTGIPYAGAVTDSSNGAGRFAPSPTGEFHVGNLRTAMLAWLFARSSGRRFLLRVEDLDRVRAGSEEIQREDLAAVGVTFDPPLLRQSEEQGRYAEVLQSLDRRGLLYECFCSRKEIAAAIEEAASAPNGGPGAHAPALYPGTCRDLSASERERRRERLAQQGRRPALRIAADVRSWAVDDELCGHTETPVDDFVVQRNDGAFAYNLVSVVDDAFTGVDQVVRGDDLLDSAGRQAWLAGVLGLPVPSYAHVPLALNAEGRRLAKRDGAVTLRQLSERLGSTEAAVGLILDSLRLPGGPRTLGQALEAFTPARVPREPWVFTA